MVYNAAMWHRVMAVNSFAVAPLALIFTIYTGVRAILFLEWKLFLLAFVILLVSLAGNAILAALAD